MKIINKDNFDRDYMPDTLVAENISKYYAEIIVKILNGHEGETSSSFFKVVENDYKLYKFEP